MRVGEAIRLTMKKIEDIVVYRNRSFYCAFPSVVCLSDGELITAFRRAPNRKRFGAKLKFHTDPNSYLVLVRSRDNGTTWSPEPELMFAHPMGGSQDPCMTLLSDDAIIASSYAWTPIDKNMTGDDFPGFSVRREFHLPGNEAEEHPLGVVMMLLGGYLVKSTDRGRSWQEMPPPPARHTHPVPGNDAVANRYFNRGNILEGSDRRLYWAVRDDQGLVLLISDDRGESWRKESLMVPEDEVKVNETSLVETAANDLVAFSRSGGFKDHGVIVRSRDHGKTWEPWQNSGIIGHPYHALRLPDNRIFLTYGYRHEPYGVRARLLDPECRCLDSEELVIRDDGVSYDIGYPWSCLTTDGKVFVVYYINMNRDIVGIDRAGDSELGACHIAAARVEV